jgi:hypothetical protein
MWSSLLAAVATSAAASAEEPAHCVKVRSRAAGDAALLFAPTVQAQGIRFPATHRLDTGVSTGSGDQLRAVLTWSPLDFYKGFRVRALGDAECRAFEAAAKAEEVFREGADYGRLPALQRQRAFLDARREVWAGIAARAEERFGAHTISVLELTEIRVRVTGLERRREAVQSEAERLEIRGVHRADAPLSQLAAEADARAMEYERETSRVRALAPWQVTATGGIIPQDKPVDYFAMVQIGLNLGVFSHAANETRYLDARRAELSSARYERRDQVRRLRAELRSVGEQVRRELTHVDEELAALRSVEKALASSDAPQAPHALAVIGLEAIAVEGEHVYLSELASELKHFEEINHAR